MMFDQYFSEAFLVWVKKNPHLHVGLTCLNSGDVIPIHQPFSTTQFLGLSTIFLFSRFQSNAL